MNLENTIRKVSLSLAGLALAANISCGTSQREKDVTNYRPEAPVTSSVEQAGPGNSVLSEQKYDISKARVLQLHHHRQFSQQDLRHYYRDEYPATKNISFNQYKRYVEKKNQVIEGNMVDLLKLPDLNGNRKVGSRDFL